MKKFLPFAALVAVIVSGCGEDVQSRYVKAPELTDTSGLASKPGVQNGGDQGGKGTAPGDCSALTKETRDAASAFGPVVVRAGERRAFPVPLPEVPGCPWSVSVEPDPAQPAADGEIGTVGEDRIYSAPDSVPTTTHARYVVTVAGRPELTAHVPVRVVPKGPFFLPDDGKAHGAVGNVYKLAENTKALPNFDMMTPVTRILSPNIDVPLRNYAQGVPGLDGYNEWFGIRFDFDLWIPASGSYAFAVESDDGSRLVLDGKTIIENDGLHSSRRVETGELVTLSAGRHALRLDYFQGPRDSIQIQLFWRTGASAAWEIVPIDVFRRPSK